MKERRLCAAEERRVCPSKDKLSLSVSVTRLLRGSVCLCLDTAVCEQRCHKRRDNLCFRARPLLRPGTACQTECSGKETLSALVREARVGTNVCQREPVGPHHHQPALQFQPPRVKEQLRGWMNLQKREQTVVMAGPVFSVIDPEGRTTIIARWMYKGSQWRELLTPILLRRLTIGGTSTILGYKVKQG